MPPSNDWSAFSNSSIEGRSRWLVGSSRMRRLGLVASILIIWNLAFCPPESVSSVWLNSSVGSKRYWARRRLMWLSSIVRPTSAYACLIAWPRVR